MDLGLTLSVRFWILSPDWEIHVHVRKPDCKAQRSRPGELCFGSRASPSKMWSLEVQIESTRLGRGLRQHVQSVQDLQNVSVQKCVHACIPGKHTCCRLPELEKLESRMSPSPALLPPHSWGIWITGPCIPSPSELRRVCLRLWVRVCGPSGRAVICKPLCHGHVKTSRREWSFLPTSFPIRFTAQGTLLLVLCGHLFRTWHLSLLSWLLN